MKNVYLLVPVLCAGPVLQSCTSLPTASASYPVTSLLDVRHAHESPDAYYQLGRYYQAHKRLDNAAQAYERALALRPGYEHAANALAAVYAMQGKYDQAIAGFRAAIDASPGNAYLYNNLGYVYYLQGNYRQAIAAFESAVGFEPENQRALNNLGLAYAKSGAVGKSHEAFARAAAIAHRPPEKVAPASGAREQAPQSVGESRGAAATSAPVEGAAVFVLHKNRGVIVRQAPASASRGEGVSYTRVDTNALTTGSDSGRSAQLVQLAPSIYELRPIGHASHRAGVALAADAPAKSTAIPSSRQFRLEVSNGNGKTGMARRVAERLKRMGMDPKRLTNQTPWQRATEIQFSEGYALEAAQLAGLLQQRVSTVRNDGLRKDIKVRLVLGKDIRNELALIVPGKGDSKRSTQVASAR